MYFDAADLSHATVSDNVGSVNVFFTNKENYAGNGVVRIEDNLGLVTVHVPDEWNVVTRSHDNLGQISVPMDHHVPDGKVLTLVIEDNLGKTAVSFE